MAAILEDAVELLDNAASKSTYIDVVVIGAGFADASTAAALARVGVTSGLVLEWGLVPGTHASGRNAAIARQVESDPALLKLAVEGVRLLRMKSVEGCPVFCQSGGSYLVHGDTNWAAKQIEQLRAQCVPNSCRPSVLASASRSCVGLSLTSRFSAPSTE